MSEINVIRNYRSREWPLHSYKKQYGDMETDQARQLELLQEECGRLKE